MYINKERLIESLSKEDVIKILESLGCEKPRIGVRGELIFRTFCHGGDSHKLYYYHEKSFNYPAKIFHCYTKCSESFSIIELVIRVKRTKGEQITWVQSLNYIAKIVGYTSKVENRIIKNKIEDLTWIENIQNQIKSNNFDEDYNIYSENILQIFSHYPHKDFLDDNITREVLSEFEISYYGLTNQIVIPHRNIHGELIGIRGRYLNKEDVEKVGKYVPMNIENKFLAHSLGKNLYGIHINRQNIMKTKKVLLVEGEKGVMQMHSYFGTDDFSLAICGSNISQTQINILLNDLKVNEVMIGLDKMYEDIHSAKAEAYKNSIHKKIQALLPYCKVSVLWDFDNQLEYKQAPIDKGKDVFLNILNKRLFIDE